MADNKTQQQRSENMSKVKNRNTKPELVVRSLLHRMGYRFRLHRKDLPGSPDIVLPKYKKVIFVHGCFWHGHPGCKRAARPTSNQDFWNAKIDINISRDQIAQAELTKLGWQVLTIWQCDIKDLSSLEDLLRRYMV